MRPVLRLLGTGLREFAFPSSCAGCGRAGTLLCLLCAPRRPPVTALSVAGVDVRAATDYDGGVRRAVLAFKERDRHDLAAPLGALLARALAGTEGVLVPVPSTAAAARRRGGDHVRRLADAARRQTGRPVVAALALRRVTLTRRSWAPSNAGRTSPARFWGGPRSARTALRSSSTTSRRPARRSARRCASCGVPDGWLQGLP